MTTEEIKTTFISMSMNRQIPVLALFAHNLTICARSAYLPEVPDGRARRRLRGFNEILHTVTGQLMHMVSGDSERYPDDTFINIVLESAQADHCERDVAQAFEWSYSAA